MKKAKCISKRVVTVTELRNAHYIEPEPLRWKMLNDKNTAHVDRKRPCQTQYSNRTWFKCCERILAKWLDFFTQLPLMRSFRFGYVYTVNQRECEFFSLPLCLAHLAERFDKNATFSTNGLFLFYMFSFFSCFFWLSNSFLVLMLVWHWWQNQSHQLHRMSNVRT